MYQLVAFIPETHLESVKQAMFDAGAGQSDKYIHCAFQVRGTGQFKPTAAADPYYGQVDELEVVAEYRVEISVPDQIIKDVIAALVQAHPYEQPAYSAWQVDFAG